MPIRRARRLAAAAAAEAERKALIEQNGSAPQVPAYAYQSDHGTGQSAPPPAKADNVLALAPPEKLQELVALALQRAHDILSIKLDPQAPDFIKLVSLQQSTLASVLGTQARTDPGRLRGQQGDKIGEILDRLRAGAA